MLKSILRFFGILKKEYHHIIDELNATTNKAIKELETVEHRKLAEAEDHRCDAQVAKLNAEAADVIANQARDARGKLVSQLL